jgi:hypothetical protein
LESLLVARRIYLAYWFSCTYDNSDKNGYIYQDLTGNSDIGEYSVSQFVNRLCVKSELLPQGILPEEKSWLNTHHIEIY